MNNVIEVLIPGQKVYTTENPPVNYSFTLDTTGNCIVIDFAFGQWATSLQHLKHLKYLRLELEFDAFCWVLNKIVTGRLRKIVCQYAYPESFLKRTQLTNMKNNSRGLIDILIKSFLL